MNKKIIIILLSCLVLSNVFCMRSVPKEEEHMGFSDEELGDYWFAKRPSLAIFFYKKAIEEDNSASAMNMLAWLYETQNKIDLAEKYYLMSAQNEFVPAMNNLGRFYALQQRFRLAERYYKMAATTGYSSAIINLILLFARNKTENVKPRELEQYYKLLQAKQDVINRYAQRYPNNWKFIKETMEKLKVKEINK